MSSLLKTHQFVAAVVFIIRIIAAFDEQVGRVKAYHKTADSDNQHLYLTSCSDFFVNKSAFCGEITFEKNTNGRAIGNKPFEIYSEQTI